MAVASGHLNSTGVLLEVGGVLPMIHGGDLQQTPNTVAASPAASGKSSLFHIYFTLEILNLALIVLGF